MGVITSYRNKEITLLLIILLNLNPPYKFQFVRPERSVLHAFVGAGKCPQNLGKYSGSGDLKNI